MSEVLSNTGVKLWSETDYNELWLTVFDQLTGQGGKSNIRLIDEAIGKINDALNEYKFEFSSEENRLYISKGDSKLPVSLIDSKGHVASKVDGTTITIDESGVVKGIPVDDALSEESTNPLQNKVIAGELKNIKSQMATDESTIKQNTSDIKSNTSRIEANETALSLLNGDGEGSVKKAVSDGIAEVVAGAPEDFDTLKEMSDWISNHESSASAMNTQIQDNKKAIDNHVSNADVHITPAERTKLKGITEGANKTTTDTSLSTSSTNPVQNKVITAKVNGIESNISNNTEKINSLETEVSKLPEWSKSATKPTYTKDEVGLGNVDNTADADKSVKHATSADSATNATKVNNHTVNSDVPSGAKFTDTTYSAATTSKMGLVKPDGTTITADEDGTLHGVAKVTVDTALSSTSTNPVQNKVVNAAIVKKADTLFYDKSANTLSLKSGSTTLSSVEIKSGGGATITPKPTVNPQIKNDDKKVVITWQDPTNTVIEGSTFSTWAGTKLVMKESGYPTSPDDGTVLVNNTTRDKYKTTGFTKDGLTNDKQYYFALFPYSTDGVYNYDSGNRLLGEPTELKIVTFAGGTDAEIAKMIQAHYNNKIKISDYWAVGDTRSVSLSAMSATGVGESHRTQTVQLVILGFDHDDLTTAINGHSKAAVSVGLKDCLMDASNASNPVNGSNNTENGYMNSTATNSGGWKNCARRTWCNNVFFAALPSTWQSMVKTVNKKVSAGNNSSTIETVQDKIFLAAEIEIFGSTTYSFAGEGTQYQYYKNATANRYKMPKWSSSYVSHIYWERSPCSGNSTSFCTVSYYGGAGATNADAARGVAPCLCI